MLLIVGLAAHASASCMMLVWCKLGFDMCQVAQVVAACLSVRQTKGVAMIKQVECLSSLHTVTHSDC